MLTSRSLTLMVSMQTHQQVQLNHHLASKVIARQSWTVETRVSLKCSWAPPDWAGGEGTSNPANRGTTAAPLGTKILDQNFKLSLREKKNLWACFIARPLAFSWPGLLAKLEGAASRPYPKHRALSTTHIPRGRARDPWTGPRRTGWFLFW